MGIDLTYFVLYPPSRPGAPWPLARVIRPSAPNSVEPALDFAEALASAKAHALVRAWLASIGELSSSVAEPIGCSAWNIDTSFAEHPIHAFLGGEFDVWWARSNKNPADLAIGPARDEADFWRWIDDETRGRTPADLRHPAERVRVRLLTEADARLVDHPLLLVEDLDWLSREQFEYLDGQRGLETELTEALAVRPVVTPEEIGEAKADLIDAAIGESDLHTAAFLCIDLARFHPDAAIEWIEALAEELDDTDSEHEYVPGALARALHSLRGQPACEALIEHWRDSGLAAKILAELAECE